MSPVTLRRALCLTALRRGSPEVVAGRDQLDREIRWVHAGEARHIATLLKGGELLLTTGMGIGASESEQRRYVAELCHRGIAGLAVELGTVFDALPAPLVEEAKARALPLIVLHREVAFVELTEALHREIVDDHAVLDAYAEEVRARLTDLLLDGAGLPELVGAVADIVANPVVLARDDVGLLYHVPHRLPDSVVLAAWNACERGFDGAPEHVSADVRMGQRGRWGRVVALALESPLDEQTRVALERTADVVSVELRGRRDEALLARVCGDFLAALIAQKVTEPEAAARAQAAGFRHRSPLLLPVVLDLGGEAGDSAGTELGVLGLVTQDVVRDLGRDGTPALAGTDVGRGSVLVVAGLDDPAQRAELAEQVARALRTAVERRAAPGDPVVCAGAASTTWVELGAALAEAADAAVGVRSTAPALWHDVTRPGLDQLLYRLRDSEDLSCFAARRLGPLLEHDRARKVPLLPTLAAFCAHGGHKAATARALHLERRSLYYRLARIEALLEVSLSDPETLLELHLAVRVLAQSHSAR